MPSIDLEGQPTQAAFGELVGISQAAVSHLVSGGVLPAGGTVGAWLLAYCERLREQAAGRLSADGAGLDLVQERAALARSQRTGQDIKNAVALGTYGPIELLGDVLSSAAQAVVDRFEQIPAALRRVCPDLPQPAFDTVMRELASARNEMVRKTSSLLDDLLDEADQPVEDEPADVLPADDDA